jgi:hypothetical protein
MKQSFLFSISLLFILTISIIGGTGCANIVPPQGGPRDSLPPRLVRALPADSTLNFRGNRIELTFDEFVDLQNTAQNILVTPTFEIGDVSATARLRTITIRFRDSLEANTTYTVNFGSALKDINEGNVAPNFSYVFSTGPTFDTLSLSGNVVLAENGKIDTTLIAVLYRNQDDSAVIKERPNYITRLNSNGSFTFRNLPSGTFALYTMDPASRRYSNRQYFAFADTPVVIKPNMAPVTLYAYKEIATLPTGAGTSGAPARRDANDRRLRWTANLNNNQQDLLKDLVLTFEQPLRFVDSTKLRLTLDSTFTPVAFQHSLDTTGKLLTIKTAWSADRDYNLILDREFAEDTLERRLLKTDTLSFTTRKLSDYGSLRIRLRNADTAQRPVLQLLQNNAIIYSTPIASGEMTIPQFTPGEYDLQVLYDRNNNGKWDAGQFFGTKRQPEIVRPITRRITVRGGTGNDFEVSL